MACVHPITCWSLRGRSPKKLVFQKPQGADIYRYEELQIPCGQCIGCRLDYSRDWATRIIEECKQYGENNWFVTLTYSPEHIKETLRYTLNLETGERIEGYSLVPYHLKKFMKDLRRWFEYNRDFVGIRFYAVGEYGDLNSRPHYHLCLFNLPLTQEDLIPFFVNMCGDQIYQCPLLQKIWNRGIISVGKVTWQSAAYVARYMLKKQKGKDAKWFYDSQALLPEFSRMSRRPGIGRQFYDDNKDSIYSVDNLVVPGRGKAIVMRPPKYYDRLFDLDCPEAMAAIKERRKQMSIDAQEVQSKNTNLSPEEINLAKERSLTDRSRALYRAYENGKE